MYLRCNNCEWEQDDFWGHHYNPLKSLQSWEKMLLEDDLDEMFYDSDSVEDNENITKRQLLVNKVRQAANRIENMKYKTFSDFKNNNSDCTCPKCGGKLSVD